MSTKEWKELCSKYDVQVIDIDYKEMSYDEGIEYFELLKKAMDVAFEKNY